MKTTQQTMKIPFILLMTALLFLQSCAIAYKTTPISLEEASGISGPFKLENTDGRIYYLRDIWRHDSTYYGDHLNASENPLRIYPEYVTALYDQDIKGTKKNKRRTIIAVTSPIWVLAILVAFGVGVTEYEE
jgi:hypothetical protein